MLPVILSKFVLKEHQKEPVFPRWNTQWNTRDLLPFVSLPRELQYLPCWGLPLIENPGTEQARQVPSLCAFLNWLLGCGRFLAGIIKSFEPKLAIIP